MPPQKEENMGKKDGKQQTGNRHRDLKKRLINGGWVAVAAIENQETVD